MLSITSSASPSATVWPAATSSDTTTPGIGACARAGGVGAAGAGGARRVDAFQREGAAAPVHPHLVAVGDGMQPLGAAVQRHDEAVRTVLLHA